MMKENTMEQTQNLTRFLRQIETLAITYTNAVMSITYPAADVRWDQHSERQRAASRIVATAFLNQPDTFTAADCQHAWAMAMAVWCADHDQTPPPDANLTYAEMPLLSQMGEMCGLRAMRETIN